MRAVVHRPAATALAGLAAGVAAAALFVNYAQPFRESLPPAPRIPDARRTITLNWNESFQIKRATGELAFLVSTVSLNKDGSWTVSASFRNNSTVRVVVSTTYDRRAGGKPALVYRTDSPSP